MCGLVEAARGSRRRAEQGSSPREEVLACAAVSETDLQGAGPSPGRIQGKPATPPGRARLGAAMLKPGKGKPWDCAGGAEKRASGRDGPSFLRASRKRGVGRVGHLAPYPDFGCIWKWKWGWGWRGAGTQPRLPLLLRWCHCACSKGSRRQQCPCCWSCSHLRGNVRKPPPKDVVWRDLTKSCVCRVIIYKVLV